ncbi:MAG TPA: zinc-dependent metalloprotease family protein [Flavipsychrobacter sp.]|nr:zinc-dependent metalloprotease family protein [Flavipsychrobacter sp.]
MRKITLAICLALSLNASANFPMWSKLSNVPTSVKQVVFPNAYTLLQLQESQLKSLLSTDGVTIQLPTPDGKTRSFTVASAPCMEAGLAAKFPEIKTYTGIATDNKSITAKFDFTYTGFHALVFDGSNTYIIDPYSYTSAGGYYVCYYQRDSKRDYDWSYCGNTDNADSEIHKNSQVNINSGGVPPVQLKVNGATRKNYRLAVACTGEYSVAVAGSSAPSKALSLSAIVTSINRVNGLYEREVGVHMDLISNNEDVIYLDGSSDPFSNSSGNALMGQNQTNMDAVIGTTNYDVGHVFSTGGGGIAQLGSVCDPLQKAQGVTGQPNPTGAAFDYDFVAHEMGHQFGAVHTFNANTGSCTSNGISNAAYEPGSGSTIMAYAGICGNANNIQSHSDAYFHAKSLDQISDFLVLNGALCATSASSGNTPPSVPGYQQTYQIPYLTPFELIAPDANDSDHDTLTYCWEEWDLGSFGASFANTTSSGPIFRSYTPSLSKTRIFTRLDSLRKNKTNYLGEKLPEVTRILNFKLTVRDVLNGYGTFNVHDDLITLNVTNTSGPFRVIYPNVYADYLQSGTSSTITWDVANTTAAPVSCSNVDILLSVDDGITFPYILASNTANDGSEMVNIPAGIYAGGCRIKIKGVGNVFFDMSNEGFRIFPWSSSSVNNVEGDNAKVYPVPAKEVLNIEMKGSARYIAIITNAIGQQVHTTEIQNKAVVNTAQWAAGFYSLQLINRENNEVMNRKFVVQ